jgi:hypothetical protein
MQFVIPAKAGIQASPKSGKLAGCAISSLLLTQSFKPFQSPPCYKSDGNNL